jgi:uracil-DNA glycosylase
MTVKIHPAWRSLLEVEFAKPYFRSLTIQVRQAYLTQNVFPPPKQLFRAFDLCQPQDVKVVILGQDPYHTPGVADGLAFSSLPGNRIPPSLQNIYKEIEREYDTPCIHTPDLTRWATQGVLLLNATLTVQSGLANSHAPYGWHTFTDAIIQTLATRYEHLVFLLWGSFAGKKSVLIPADRHLILTSAHPSPLSAHRGFLGNNHFRKANEYLALYSRTLINWM